MADDQNNDSGNSQANQNADSGNQNAQPLTINAELLGDLKDDPVFKPFDGKPVSEVFKSFKNAQSLIGGEKIVLPQGKLDTPENWNHVFDKLGRPKTVDGYKLSDPKLPDGLKLNDGTVKEFKKIAHFVGLLPWQADALYQFDAKRQADAYNAFQVSENKRAEETEAMLMQELGTKEKYEEYKNGANAALKRFGGDPQTVEAFIDKFGNDPLVVKVFGNVAKGMMEDAALRGDKNFNLLGNEDISATVNDIMGNKSNKYYEAYWSASHPQHNYAVDMVTKLLQQKHNKGDA